MSNGACKYHICLPIPHMYQVIFLLYSLFSVYNNGQSLLGKKKSAFFIWNVSLKISPKLVTVSFVLSPGLNPLLKFLREIDESKTCNIFHFPFRGTFGNIEGGKILSFNWSQSDVCRPPTSPLVFKYI